MRTPDKTIVGTPLLGTCRVLRPDAISVAATVLTLVASVLLTCMAQFALGEDDIVVDGPLIPGQQNQDIMRIGVGNFDEMLFQLDGNGAKAEQQVLARTELQIAEITRVCQLSDEQTKKLQLAAKGDVQRLLSEAIPVRVKFKLVAKNGILEGPNAMEVYNRLQQELQPLRQRFNRGLTDGPDSLLSKVLSRTLTTEQQAKYEVMAAERRRFRYEAGIAVSLLNLEEVVFLTEPQRDSITSLLLEMPPPRHTGQYESYVILGRLARIPTGKLQSQFNPRQWQALSVHLNQYSAVVKSLVDSGLLDAAELPAPAQTEQP